MHRPCRRSERVLQPWAVRGPCRWSRPPQGAFSWLPRTVSTVMLTMMTAPWSPPNPRLSPPAPGRHGRGVTPRSRAGIGLALIAFALAGTVFAALPYFGVGPDTSPTARTYIERRYGNIGIGLTAFWLIAMAVVLVVGIVVTLRGTIPRRRSKPW